jgi:hypothetical protein
MKMTNEKQTLSADQKSRTRYVWITRYETEASALEGKDAPGNMKNFPRTFIPRNELEESR